MRVAIIAGPIAYAVALSNALSKFCKIDLYSSRRYASKEDLGIFKQLAPGVTPILYKDFRKRDPRNIVAYFAFYNKICKENYDIIHFQTAGEWPLIIMWKKLRKTPICYTVMDPYHHSGIKPHLLFYIDFMQTFLVKHADRIFVHGATMKNSFHRRYPFKKPELVVNTINAAPTIDSVKDIEKRNYRSREKIVLFFGNVRHNKGVPYLVKAEPFISGKIDDYKIHILGRCHDPKYKEFIKNMEHFVIREDFIPHDEVEKIFYRSTILVLPYLDATDTALIPLAYSFGMPVVATATGGLVDLVEDGRTGFLVKPKDEKALAGAIIKLLSDDSLCEQMGRNGHEFVKKNLSWESAAKNAFDIYQELVKSK